MMFIPLVLGLFSLWIAPAGTTPNPATPIQKGFARLEERAKKDLESALSSYEKIRGQLASDSIEGVPDAAKALKKAATHAAQSAPKEIATYLENLINAAKKLKAAADLDAARLAFGEASQALIFIGAKEDSLSKGRYVFECSMAKGFQKWIQNDTNISNPYMGNQMKHCGDPSSWK